MNIFPVSHRNRQEFETCSNWWIMFFSPVLIDLSWAWGSPLLISPNGLRRKHMRDLLLFDFLLHSLTDYASGFNDLIHEIPQNPMKSPNLLLVKEPFPYWWLKPSAENLAADFAVGHRASKFMSFCAGGGGSCSLVEWADMVDPQVVSSFCLFPSSSQLTKIAWTWTVLQ